MKNKPMKKDLSVGVIPYRRTQNGFEFLVIQQSEGHWAFPKGHPTLDEAPEDTALRELFEETGVTVSALDKHFSCNERYVFKRSEEEITKDIVLFLGLVNESEVKIDSNEVNDYSWLSYDEAVTRLTYDESRKSLKKAFQYIEKAAF